MIHSNQSTPLTITVNLARVYSVGNRVWLDYNGEPVQSVSLPTEYSLTIAMYLVRVYHCQLSMA